MLVPFLDENGEEAKPSGTRADTRQRTRHPATCGRHIHRVALNGVPRVASGGLIFRTMIPLAPLQRLHDLDRDSPQFHEQLSEFLRGDEYRGIIPKLQREDFVLLAEYLDNVSPQTALPHHTLMKVVAGSRLYFRPCKPCIPGALA